VSGQARVVDDPAAGRDVQPEVRVCDRADDERQARHEHRAEEYRSRPEGGPIQYPEPRSGAHSRERRVPYHRFSKPGIEEVERGVLSKYLRLRGLLAREDGQGLVEYALILVLVAIVVIGVLTTMGTKIQAAFQDIVNKMGG
jgi:pilus assembly protein Flp/PilA